jgi:hypothetical protein
MAVAPLSLRPGALLPYTPDNIMPRPDARCLVCSLQNGTAHNAEPGMNHSHARHGHGSPLWRRNTALGRRRAAAGTTDCTKLLRFMGKYALIGDLIDMMRWPRRVLSWAVGCRARGDITGQFAAGQISVGEASTPEIRNTYYEVRCDESPANLPRARFKTSERSAEPS